VTDELRAAAERYRRGEDGYRNSDPTLDPTGWMASAAHDGDARLLAAAYLAEHPDDDGEPIDFEWLATQAKRCHDEGYWDQPPTGDVWWEAGPLSFTCDSFQSDPGEPTETVAADWQVDGEPLPRAMVPKTRGQFRRLLAALGVPS
jgi:hypothetical protein